MSTTISTAPNQVLDAFEGSIERVEIPSLYRLAVFLVAGAMMLLPVAYLCIIALAAYGVYYHATENLAILQYGTGSGSGRVWLWKVVVGYIGPLFAGVMVAFFMIKPLFSRPPKGPEPFRVKREDEPLLFAFVERICELVGAPPPKEIHVDCQVNASASFRRGFMSFLGRDLVLTIGLPLAAGMRVDQLGGVFAHEFGHFAQSVGMRFTYVIRSINMWFARVVYERDHFDIWLDETRAMAEYWMVKVLLRLAETGVKLSRWVLAALMNIGHWISSFLSRQMEFDADRYEARLAGSDTFGETAVELNLLNTAFGLCSQQLSRSWGDGFLVDDLPGLVGSYRKSFAPEMAKRVLASIEEQTTGRFSTHPCDKDRIESARQEAARGIFRLQEPAPVLFTDFESLSQDVTDWYYKQNLGDDAGQAKRQSVEVFRNQQMASMQAASAAREYFMDMLHVEAPLVLHSENGVGDPVEQLRLAKAHLEQSREKLKESFDRYIEADLQRTAVLQQHTLKQAGFEVDPNAVAFARSGDTHLNRALDEAEKGVTSRRPALDDVAKVLTERLWAALRLVDLAEAERIEGIEEKRVAKARLTSCLPAFQRAAPKYSQLFDTFESMKTLLQNIAGHEEDDTTLGRLQGLVLSACDSAQELRALIGDCDYPFDVAQGKKLLRDAVVTDIPSTTDAVSSYRMTEQILANYNDLFTRVMGGLALIAQAVEETVLESSSAATAS